MVPRATRHCGVWPLAATLLMVLSACVTYNPRPLDEVPFKVRAHTQSKGNVRVTAAVLSEEESKAVFSLPLYDEGIQPVWLKIENDNELPMWFAPISLDPNYYAPLEVAYHHHTTWSAFIPVPGLYTDHRDIHWEYFYPEILTYDEDDFRKWLEELPCCTTNQDGTGQGDPLNLIVIGYTDDVFNAFLRAGWDETETIYWDSAWKTVRSFLLGGRYRYSPISSLYVFGRRQDVAFQKARDTIHERNHLRLWMAPIRFKQQPVWVGQISRDIGVRLLIETVTTHKIDPDVDETRLFRVQDLVYSQGLAKFAYVRGVDVAPITKPRTNLTGDPYFTDGYRTVLWVSADPVEIENLKFVEWELPDRLFQ